MVQFKNGMKGIAPFALGALALYSCSDDDENLSNNDLLIGEWKLVSVDGDVYTGEEYDGYTYAFGWTFESDGDFGYCYETTYDDQPENNESYCEIEGEWEWMNDEQTMIGINASNDSEIDYTLTIESITSTRLEGDLIDLQFPDESYKVIFEKYDFEE